MVPDIVYHYCSTEVFTKIIKEKSIRLSDITKSNDSMELKWALNCINASHRNLREEMVIEQPNFFLDSPSQIVLDKSVIKNRALVCCFSEEGDLLSQWRGYADDAQGFAIGFDAKVLDQFGFIAQKEWEDSACQYYSGFRFDKVIYDEKEQVEEITRIARRLIQKRGQGTKITAFDFWAKVINSFPIIAFVKNPFFKEEKEWRLCEWGIDGLSELYCDDKEGNYRLSIPLMPRSISSKTLLFINYCILPNLDKDTVVYLEIHIRNKKEVTHNLDCLGKYKLHHYNGVVTDIFVNNIPATSSDNSTK